MSTAIRRYLRETGQEEYEKGFSPEQVEASRLRIDFLKEHIVNADTNNYK